MTISILRHILKEFGTSISLKQSIGTFFQPKSKRANFAGKSASKSVVSVKIACEIKSVSMS